MTLLECLESDIFTKPKKIGSEGMIKYLDKSFAAYLNTIKLISDQALSREINLHLPSAQKFCDGIILSLKHYNNDNIEVAYSEFKNTMEVYKPFLFPENKGVVANIIGLHKPFYRARTGPVNLDLRSAMFHLPFSQRANASTQRFSSQGLPCLYLSNSIYTCWEELNRPSLDNFYVSRFQQENMDLNILDLSLTSDRIRISRKLSDHYTQGKHDYDFVAFWYLMVWPLSFICSLPVANESLPFKQEYIFPQFLLRWVRLEKGVDGIKYPSVKWSSYNVNHYSHFTNYVFPPKSSDSDYCSHLAKSFKLTKAVSLQLLKIVDPNFIFITPEWLDKIKYKVEIDNIILELIQGYPMPYTHTTFGKTEFFTHNLDVDFLDLNEFATGEN